MAPFENFEKTRDKLGERLRQLTVYLSDPLLEKESAYIVKELLRAAKKMEKIQTRGQNRQQQDTDIQICFQLRCEAIKRLLRLEGERIERGRIYNSFFTAIVVHSFALHLGCLVVEDRFTNADGWAELAFNNLLCHDGLWELEWVMPKDDPRRKEIQRKHDVAWTVRHPLSSEDCEARHLAYLLWRSLTANVPNCKCFQCFKIASPAVLSHDLSLD
ncbi:uncharacterized protein N7496_007966 [Penicillium cataractarum]|uniref:Uncharacterized protein n=1 Tax=Penicillium cataractarum TaxID=2100454 RepID=A0A9W9RXJ6_9EURO|nr:uncharacterized protein N7496_007966 [Penicillium cataractarum]KAJ5368206.1 hypothetical protein N7496_007966 [Penicillium cataractarum]